MSLNIYLLHCVHFFPTDHWILVYALNEVISLIISIELWSTNLDVLNRD